MNEQESLLQQRNRPSAAPAQAPVLETPHASLLAQAQAWASVSREAHERVKKGADALEELHRLRNRSGQ